MARIVRADYDQLAEVARIFESEGANVGRKVDGIRRQMEVLEGGDWIGQGARAFYREMHSEVLPALQRLVKALASAARAAQQASQAMKEAEEGSATLFWRVPGGGDEIVDALRQAGSVAQAEVAGLGAGAQAGVMGEASGSAVPSEGSPAGGGGIGSGASAGAGGGSGGSGGGGSWDGEIGFRQERPGPRPRGRRTR